ncbi:MAG: hypothetical protein KDD64_12205 [Bdellovibrionales bacterium]|nr:hypothetical protein [Bdellovibrionales bacterium]
MLNENLPQSTQLVLLAFNRPYHTEQVLRAIKREGFGSVRVYLDAPESERDVSLQGQILELLQGQNELEIDLRRRSKPLRLAKAVTRAVSETLADFEQVIVLEDDCVPQPGFRKYMASALAEYAERQQVRSICGYTYPCVPVTKSSHRAFFSERFCPWGWATWRNRWKDFDVDLKRILRKVQLERRSLSHLGSDIDRYCSNPQFLENKVDIWSLNWILVHLLTDSLALYPPYSLVQNIGFDGSGVHSAKTKIFDNPSPTMNQAEIDIPRSNFAVSGEIQEQMIRFLEETSKMTMLLRGGADDALVTIDDVPKSLKEGWAAISKTWIVPAAGLGIRTRELGSCKPLIDILGLPLFQWFLRSIRNLISEEDKFVIVTTGRFMEDLQFESKIRASFQAEAVNNKVVFCRAESTPRGPAASVLLSKERVDPSRPAIVINCDQFIHFNLPTEYDSKVGFLAVYQSSDPSKSYVTLNEECEISGVVEKRVVSSLASSGVYAVPHAKLLFEALEEQLKREDTVSGEFFVGPALNYLIERGIRFLPVPAIAKYDLGTTQRIRDFEVVAESLLKPLT